MAAKVYYPPPESQGGWRWLPAADAVREQAGMDAARLDQIMQQQEWLHYKRLYASLASERYPAGFRRIG